MALKYLAYVFLSPGFSSEKNTVLTENDQCKFKAIGIDFKQKGQVVEIAQTLIKEGVQMLELCGGFGPIWIAKVSEAIDYAIPVGSTSYGPEARKPILDILA